MAITKKTLSMYPGFPRQMIENEKKAAQKYREEHPDSLIPDLERELRENGFVFEVGSQTFGFVPKHKKTIVPITLRYYRLARDSARYNEQNHFLRYLAFRGNDEVVPILIDDLCAAQTPSLTGWFIADALYQIGSTRQIDDVIRIAADPRFGVNRQMLILLIGRLKVERAIPILIDLLDDPEVCLQAIAALGCFKREELRGCFLRFRDDERPGRRKAARSALKKLDGRQKKENG